VFQIELKKVKKCLKNQETDGCGRDKRPKIEKLKKKEMTIIETRKKLKRRKNRKAVRISVKSVRRCQMSMEGRI